MGLDGAVGLLRRPAASTHILTLWASGTRYEYIAFCSYTRALNYSEASELPTTDSLARANPTSHPYTLYRKGNGL